jgi:predicted phosphohydrolase
MNNLGKLLIAAGVIFIILGAGMIIFSRFKLPFLGRLPGDIYINKGNFTFYFPLSTSILLSVAFSLIIYLLNKHK